MAVKIGVLASYFLIVLAIGFLARTRWHSSPQNYFLADRRLGPLILLATMAATNFSAFTVFGTSGAGYRDGWSFFPIMGFGTGFMALSFWVIGRRAWREGKQRGVITPPELVGALYGSRGLSLLFALVMIVFTVPYLALQPMAAGYALEELTGLPYVYGCGLVTLIIVLYTLRGGLRAVAWTDLFQGLFMFALLLAALLIMAAENGGFAAANRKVMELKPELFSRPGGLGRYTPGIWFSYMALWFFCDPMFPQLFQRFFAARDEKVLGRMMVLYPLVCTLVFLAPVGIGVLGHLYTPGLAGAQADRILPIVVGRASGEFMSALVVAAGLAALMSTMDSQLLTLSSIFTRDILPFFRSPAAAGSLPGRIFVVFLSLCGVALALKPPATILEIATETFTGLAVLFPTVLFGLYARRVYPPAAVASILAGEAALAAFHFKWVEAGPFLPAMWVVAVAFGAYLGGHLLLARRQRRCRSRVAAWIPGRTVWAFGGVFLLAMDFWAWRAIDPVFLGLPAWIGYFVLLSALQTAMMVFLVRAPD
jgi:SSS family solute:Na+ symporter